MSFQMIRVISSPSISTTGLATLILFIGDLLPAQNGLKTAGPGAWAKPSRAGARRYSIQGRAEKAEFTGRKTYLSASLAAYTSNV
jgi:hypothetical protein